MKKYILLFLLYIMLSGCVTQKTVTVGNVPLLPEDKVYSMISGTEVKVMLDNKEMNYTIPEGMKLVHTSYLVREEEKLNTVLFDKLKVEQEKKKQFSIFSSIIGVTTGILTVLGIILKKKQEKK